MDNKLNQCNNEGHRIGKWVLQDGDYNKWAEGFYVNGKRNGELVYYSRDKNRKMSSKTIFHYQEHETYVFLCGDEE